LTPLIEKWFLINHHSNCLVEIKVTKTNTIPFNAVKPHQLKALQQVRTPEGMTHKMSDASRTRQPADFWLMKNATSFVVACFLKDRICLAIDPNEWEGARNNSKCEFSFFI